MDATWRLAGYSVFVPPCMVAGPNGLVLFFFQNRVEFEICFEFRLKIKKNSSAHTDSDT